MTPMTYQEWSDSDEGEAYLDWLTRPTQWSYKAVDPTPAFMEIMQQRTDESELNA